MKAMILAAGRGERMRPLTDNIPKPLLPVGGRPLIQWHVENLARAGFRDLVINHAHLGDQIEAYLGGGERFGVSIRYSREPIALETAGGIANALVLLGEGPFLVVNGDIFTPYDFSGARHAGETLSRDGLEAHLVMVDNPPYHLAGDFALIGGRVAETGKCMLTFSGIGIYTRRLFASVTPGSSAKLAPLLRAAMAAGRVGGEHFAGPWTDVGTPQRLADLDKALGEN